VDGAQPNDIGLWLGDYCPLLCYHQRSDYNGDGVLGPGDDLSFLISDVCAGGSDRAAARCDGQMANHLLLRAEDGGLYLAWDDCRGGFGIATKTFACNTNSGSHLLVASFRAPAGVSSLAGFEEVIEVSGDVGGVLPQWWRVEPLTGCRAGAATATGSNLGFGCSEVGATTPCQIFEYPAPGGLPHKERIRIEGTASGSLVAGEEYSLFGLQIGHGKTTSPGSCAGCSRPVALVLQSLRLRQQVSPDLVMNVTSGSGGAVAYWQGPPAGFSITDVPAALAGADWLAPPAPNPAHGPVTFRFGLARESSVSLVLHDLAGRRVRVLESGTLPAGEHTASWDGRDERSERVAGGLYFVRLVRGERVLTRPIVRIR